MPGEGKFLQEITMLEKTMLIVDEKYSTTEECHTDCQVLRGKIDQQGVTQSNQPAK